MKTTNITNKAIKDIRTIRQSLKKDSVVLELLKKYNKDESFIDNIVIKFARNLGTSAKTINGVIYLNLEMLKDPVEDYIHYVVHELTHVLQHSTGACGFDSDKDYLDQPTEMEAFKNQTKYKKQTQGPEEAKRYLQQVFDRHKLDNKERREKLEELYKNAVLLIK